MTVNEIMAQLEALGSAQTKKVLSRHGAKEPFFGVKVGDLKPIQKKIKKDYALSLALYETNNSDAMYLAGLIADENQMTEADLQNWVEKANWYMISEYTVAWIAAESRFGWKLALQWIESPKENIASTGWSTLSSLVSIKQDEELDIEALNGLLDRVAREVHHAPNRVRYTMNGFVIAAGSYVAKLTEKATKVAADIGKVHVMMGETACKVPLATTYIQKIVDKDRVGKKRKMARC